jgi:hypothetical protein
MRIDRETAKFNDTPIGRVNSTDRASPSSSGQVKFILSSDCFGAPKKYVEKAISRLQSAAGDTGSPAVNALPNLASQDGRRHADGGSQPVRGLIPRVVQAEWSTLRYVGNSEGKPPEA